MSSLEENLFFRSMQPADVDTFVDNLKVKKPSFSNCPAVNRNSFDTHYQQTYGQPGCVLWLGRKTSHLILIFWDGIIKNVVNIFELFFKSMFLLARRIYHSGCFTKTLSNESSVYISEKINSLSVKIYNVAQNFVVAFGHGYSIINDKEGRFTIDQASLEKYGYSHRHLHEEAAIRGFFNNKKLGLSIQKKYFYNLLKIDGFKQETIDTLAATLIKLEKFNDSDDTYRIVLAHHLVPVFSEKNYGLQELEKSLKIVESVCNKLPNGIADKFISTIADHIITFYFDEITQTLTEKNRFQVLEMILHFIDKIKDEKSFNSLSKDIYKEFFHVGFTDYRKNFMKKNEKEFLKVFVNTNPRTFKGVLEVYTYRDKFTLHNGSLQAQTEGADWSERQKFLREAVQELLEDKPIIFSYYLDYIFTYHYYIVDYLYARGHNYLKAGSKEHFYAIDFMGNICDLKKECIKLYLDECISDYQEKPLKIGELNALDFTRALSSDSAMKIWETIIENREFIMKAIVQDRILLLKVEVAKSKVANERIRTLLCSFKYTPTLANKIPKPLQLIITGKALEIYSPIF